MKHPSGSILSVLAITLVIFSFFGCAVKDIRVDLIQIKPPEQQDLTLPIDARAEIVVPLGDGEKKIVVGNGYHVWVLDDGEAIKTTAKEVFQRLFKEVESRGEIYDPHFIIKIKADSSFNFFWGIYNVKVKTNILYGDGNEFGTYDATGSQMSMLVNDYNALENAYRKAFLDIAKKILDEPKTLALIKQGVNDSQIRVSDKTGIQLSSKYKDIANAVVTIVVEKNDNKKRHWVKGDGFFKPHGSGFFIDNNGTLLTNYHVVGNAKSIKIKTPEGDEFDAELIAQDEWIDLALLKINSTDTPYLNVDQKPINYSVGDEVIAIGSPLKEGLEHSISQGIVSSIRLIDGNKVIQTDAAINPGSSGGPLIHLGTKRVLGVVTMGVLGADGIGFALPSETIQNFLTNNKEKYNRANAADAKSRAAD